MIEVDRRDRRGDGVDDVRRVQPAAKSNLEHRDVDPLVAKHLQRQRRGRLEKARRRCQLARCLEHPTRDPIELIPADWTAIDREAFLEIDEVRRRVAARAQSRGTQPALDHRRDRSLAVRAGDDERRVRAIGVAEERDERPDLLEAELDADELERQQVFAI